MEKCLELRVPPAVYPAKETGVGFIAINSHANCLSKDSFDSGFKAVGRAIYWIWLWIRRRFGPVAFAMWLLLVLI